MKTHQQMWIVTAIVAIMLMALPVMAGAKSMKGFTVHQTVPFTNTIDIGSVDLRSQEIELARAMYIHPGQSLYSDDIELDNPAQSFGTTMTSTTSFRTEVVARLTNKSSVDMDLRFHLTSSEMDMATTNVMLTLGTVHVPAKSIVEIDGNSSMNSVINNYLNNNPNVGSLTLYVEARATSFDTRRGTVVVDHFTLLTTPSLKVEQKLNGNPMDLYPRDAEVRVNAISGYIQNRGESNMGFVMVVEPIVNDETPMFHDSSSQPVIIAQGVLAPKSSVNVSSLLVDGWEHTMSKLMSDAFYKVPCKVSIYMASQNGVRAKFDKIKIQSEVIFN